MDQIVAWLRENGNDILGALLIIVAAHFVAKAVKWAIAQAIDRIPFLSRRDAAGPGGERPAVDIGDRVGEVGYWVIWLIGLIAAIEEIKNVFPGLAPVAQPLNTMVDGFITYVPNIVGAALIFFIGFALATVARRMVEAAAEASEIDRRLVDAGLTHMPRGPGLARLIGVLVFTFIVIPVTIQALHTLGIDAIAVPATRMLEGIAKTIPDVLGAALIVLIAYVIGRWVAQLTEDGLRSIGFDDIIRSIGQNEAIRAGMDKMDPTPGVDTINLKDFPPSRMIGTAVLIGIVLVAGVQAATALKFTAVAAMLDDVLQLATRVLFGAVIIALGVLVANILAAAAARGEKASGEIMAVFVRWGVIALAAAVGLSFMGLANNIIALAFGLILGSVAVAVAVAFGVGGRDAAKKLLDRWLAE